MERRPSYRVAQQPQTPAAYCWRGWGLVVGLLGSNLSPSGGATSMRAARESRADTVSRTFWSSQEPGHYILRADAKTIGHVVEAPDGSFLSFDDTATSIARHDTLWDAQMRVQSPGALRWKCLIFANWGRLTVAAAISLAFSIATIAATLASQ